MTVLTLPSTGFKSDKVPLVDADANRHPASLQPELLLESGGACGPSPRDRPARRWACRGVKLLLAVLACALIVWLTRDGFCKAYNETASAMGLQRGNDIGGGGGDDDDDGGAATVPCKSFTSYAAAEDDLLSMMPAASAAPASPQDYDSQFDAMEDVYKQLEKFALNKALVGRRKDVDAAGTDDDDVVSVFDKHFEIAADGGAQPIAVTKSARFIHDFSVNVTGIVDVEGQRCFVMPLVRNSVSPPSSLYDLLFKMSSGYYTMDITKVMANMRVVKPALEDLSDYGLYISKDCADYSTFKLEKAVSVPTAVV